MCTLHLQLPFPLLIKSPLASCQMIHTCSLRAPIPRSSKSGLYWPDCSLCLKQQMRMCERNKHQGRGYVFPHAESKRHHKHRFQCEEKKGGSCLLLEPICSTALLINVTQWEGTGGLTTGSCAVLLGAGNHCHCVAELGSVTRWSRTSPWKSLNLKMTTCIRLL